MMKVVSVMTLSVLLWIVMDLIEQIDVLQLKLVEAEKHYNTTVTKAADDLCSATRLKFITAIGMSE